jgi:UDP-N-acetylmuramyl tripeptide synthase
MAKPTIVASNRVAIGTQARSEAGSLAVASPLFDTELTLRARKDGKRVSTTLADMPVPLSLALIAGQAVATASRALRRGAGATASGRVILALRPDALAVLSQGRNVILVSGTNGKTSTAALLRELLETVGAVGGNRTGANLDSGMVAALATRPQAKLVVLEVDEMFLPRALDELKPEHLLLLNLSRDQLHRTSEVRMVARAWREAIDHHPDVEVVIDYEDPFLAYVTRHHAKTTRVAFGKRHHLDAASCPECGNLLDWSGARYLCPQCALGSQPESLRAAGRTAVDRNLELARLIAAHYGISSDSIKPKDRVVVVPLGQAILNIRLVKNPASWIEALGSLPEGPVILIVNARGVDGLDTSWLWDVDYSTLRGHEVAVTGERRLDAAYRIHVDGVKHRVCENLADAAVLFAGSVTVLASYTAFISLTTSSRKKASKVSLK